jgi:hypothetical protein
MISDILYVNRKMTKSIYCANSLTENRNVVFNPADAYSVVDIYHRCIPELIMTEPFRSGSISDNISY